jgi:homocysteine S-methyltransferase
MSRTKAEQMAERTFLTMGGTETFLQFEQGFPLRDSCGFEVFDDDAAFDELTRQYLEPIAEAALAGGQGLLCDSIVWRASPDWFERLGFSPDDVARVNALAVARTRVAFEGWRSRADVSEEVMPILVSGDLGPRGDGYRVEPSGLTVEAARSYHRRQIGILAEVGVDLIQAMTMTNVSEAIGIALAAAEYDLPITLSATVETDGRLPEGSSLGDFIERVEQATEGAPLFYMINCAHPIHVMPTLAEARATGASWLARLRGFRANASAKSHAELDNSTTLDIGDPDDLAGRIAAMQREFDFKVVGGCCGTDARHLAAIARATAVSVAAPPRETIT